MNEKINIQNLTDELAESYGINKKDAETFIKEFFSVIEEGLEKDKYVKIKGFGTFKLIDVDSRESINVNTGERFEIQGHTKVTFTPDNNIKEAINKPFSAFQTVVLADGVTIDAPEENLVDALSDDILDDDSSVKVVTVSEEPAVQEEIKELREPIIDEPTPEEPIEEVTEVEVPTTEEPIIEEHVADERLTEEESIAKKPTKEDQIQEGPITEGSDVEESTNVNILPIFDDEAIKKKDQPVSHQQEVMALKLSEEKRKEISKKAEGSSTPYLMFLAVLAIMICLGIIAYIYYPDLAKVEEKPLSPPTSQINSLVQQAERVEETSTEEAPSVSFTTAEEQIQQTAIPVKKEVTEPIIIREESVPAATSQPQTTTAKPTAPQATTAKPTTSKPSTTQNQARPTTFKLNGVEYAVDGIIEEHVLQKGETLFSLSRKYYNSNPKYIFIVEYNRDVIKDPDNVPVGTKLRIPKVVKK